MDEDIAFETETDEDLRGESRTDNKNLVRFRASRALLARLEQRSAKAAEISLTARQDLDRYHYLLDQARPHFRLSEAELVYRVLHRRKLDHRYNDLLYALIERGIDASLREVPPWESHPRMSSIDRIELIARIRDMDALQLQSLVDAAEIAGRMIQKGVSMDEALMKSGLSRPIEGLWEGDKMG